MTRPPRRKLTPAQKAEIRRKQDGLCTRCGQELTGDTDIDHVRPLELGGSDTAENMEEIHRSPCHREKTRDDMKRIAKARRQQRFMLEGKGRKRRGKPLRGPGFKGWRRFNGDVVRRDD